ncbi:MAG: PilZ domain-containing protein [Myxococcota bacterium]
MARFPAASPLTILKQCVLDARSGTATVPRRLVGCEIQFASVNEEYLVVDCPNPDHFDRTFQNTHVVAVTFRHERRTGSFLTHVMALEPTGQALLATPSEVVTLDSRRAKRIPMASPSLVRASLMQGGAVLTASVRDATAHGLGLQLDKGQVPPHIGTTLSMYVSWPKGELETPVTVANVDGQRCGVKISLGHSRLARMGSFVQEQFLEWYRAQRQVFDAEPMLDASLARRPAPSRSSTPGPVQSRGS